MLRFLSSMFRPTEKQPVRPPEQPPSRDPEPTVESGIALVLAPEVREFYVRLVTADEPTDLQDLSPDDQLFLSGILRQLRDNCFEVPVLPPAAIEISNLLSNPNVDLKDFVDVLQSDPALSVDVLRLANSVLYGGVKRIESVRDAVVRIGMDRIHPLILISHLQGKVLQARCFQHQAAWLFSLSGAMAQICQKLSHGLDLAPHVGFTRGMLWHIEHFMIISSLSQVSKDNRKQLEPTVLGLHEAFVRFSPRIRELAARSWGLEALLIGDSKDMDTLTRIYQIRQVIVSRWTGIDLPTEVTGVDPEQLQDIPEFA